MSTREKNDHFNISRVDVFHAFPSKTRNLKWFLTVIRSTITGHMILTDPACDCHFFGVHNHGSELPKQEPLAHGPVLASQLIAQLLLLPQIHKATSSSMNQKQTAKARIPHLKLIQKTSCVLTMRSQKKMQVYTICCFLDSTVFHSSPKTLIVGTLWS